MTDPDATLGRTKSGNGIKRQVNHKNVKAFSLLARLIHVRACWVLIINILHLEAETLAPALLEPFPWDDL